MIHLSRVHVLVKSHYIKEQSHPEAQRFVFSYHVIIRNLGRLAVKLLQRYWLITNANGEKIEIDGFGVIGKTPTIYPGEEFDYTSGILLETPFGIMEGHYRMQDENGKQFNVEIPIFRLTIPKLIN